MGTFLDALTKKMEVATGQAPSWGGVNPLVVIGLTEAILDLELTEDQLYSVIRSYGRQLAGQVHPDRQLTNVSAERQRQLIGAFNVLDDRMLFSRALVDFKKLRAEDRRENRIMQQSLAAKNRQLSEYASNALAFAAEKAAFERQRAAFESEKASQAQIVPVLEREKRNLASRVAQLDRRVAKKLETLVPWKSIFEHAATYIARLGGAYPEGLFAFEAKWVVVVSTWRKKNLKDRDTTPIDRFGSVRKEFLAKCREAGIGNEQVEYILKSWIGLTKILGKPLEDEEEIRSLGISVLRLDSGEQKLLFGPHPGGTRAIGSLMPELMDRKQLRSRSSKFKVLEEAVPWIVPGGLLVSISTNERQKASWSLSCPMFFFTANKLILAVG